MSALSLPLVSFAIVAVQSSSTCKGYGLLEGEEFEEQLIWTRILRSIPAVFTARVVG